MAVRYVPYKEVGNRPNVIVDGAPLASTVLTLSHWPNNQTPDNLQCDTSTQTVFAWQDSAGPDSPADTVSNNHFDEDGLFSMFTFMQPETAGTYRALLEAGSLAGDFGIVTDPQGAKLCFVIESYADPDISPLPEPVFRGCEERRTAALYPEMLKRLPAILADLDGQQQWWQPQFEHYEFSRETVAGGGVEIEERPELDLAIVRVPDELPEKTVRRYLHAEQAAIHPFAINSVTRCNRILRLYRGGYDFHYRYESWLRFRSWRPQLRVALEPLAERLNAAGETCGEWRGEDVNEVIPRLYLEGNTRSSLAETEFLQILEDYLTNAPVAWDPWDWQER